MGLLNKNIKAFRNGDSAYERLFYAKDSSSISVEKARDGTYTAIVNNIPLQSKYSPTKEATRLLSIHKHGKKNCFFFFGLGAASHILEFCNNHKTYTGERESSAIYIFVFEENLSLAKEVFSKVDVSAVSNFNSFIFLEEENIDFSKTISPADFKGLERIPLPSLSEKAKDKSNLTVKGFLNYIENSYSNMLTSAHFDMLWGKSVIANIAYLENSFNLQSLFSKEERDIVVVAAGPSLNESIHLLKEKNICIVCVDTAYPVLMKAGIVPHFVVCVDAGFYNSLDFAIENGQFPFLLADITVHRAVFNASYEKLAFFKSSASNTKLYNYLDKNLNLPEIHSSKTVATTAIDIAVKMGGKRIVLLGHDLSYPYYHTHAKHSLSYEYHLLRSDKVNTLTSRFFEAVYKRASFEKKPPSCHTLKIALKYYEKLGQAYKGVSFYRVGEGVDIAGIEKIDNLSHFNENTRNFKADKYNFNKQDISLSLKKLVTSAENLLAILGRYMETLGECRFNEEECRNLLKNLLSEIETQKKDAPYIESAFEYWTFNRNRRNQDETAASAFLLISELSKRTVYFKSRIERILSSFSTTPSV